MPRVEGKVVPNLHAYLSTTGRGGAFCSNILTSRHQKSQKGRNQSEYVRRDDRSESCPAVLIYQQIAVFNVEQ